MVDWTRFGNSQGQIKATWILNSFTKPKKEQIVLPFFALKQLLSLYV